MKKILFLINTLNIGGSSLILTNLLRALDKSRFDCHVWSPSEGILKNELEGASIPVYIKDFYVDKINREQTFTSQENTNKRIKKLIKECKKQKKSLAIRCAGTFAQKILSENDFSDINIVGLFDSNPALIGQKICGYKVYQAESIKDFKPDIVIIAHNQPKFIKLTLDKNKYKIIDNLFINTRFLKLLNTIKYLLKLSNPSMYFGKLNPDTVLVNNIANFWAVITGKLIGKKVIWFIHEGLEPKTFRVFPQFLFFNSFKFADKFIFPANATYEFYKDFIPEHKKNVVHCGVNIEKIEKFKLTDNPETTKKELNIPLNHKIISIIGRINEIKGQIHFTRTAINLLNSSQEKNYSFVLVGSEENEYSRKIESIICDSGYEKHFKIIPVTREVYKYFNITDIYVNSSFTESFCIANLEAMAFKKPVIITNVCGNPEQVIHNETGILYSLDNMEIELEKNIKYLLENPEFAQKLAKNAYSRLINNFTFSITLNNFSKLLD